MTPGVENAPPRGALPTDHRYTGQTSDTTSAASGGTGLLFYNARHYDPTIGAFTQADTIIPDPTTPASFNRYAYVTNNPVKYSDPSGHNNWDTTINPGNNPANAVDVYGIRYRAFRLIVEGIGSGFGAHELLDLVGIVPVIGEAADVINAGLYAAEGDWTNAGISLVAAVGGDLLKGARYADDAGQLATHIDDVADLAPAVGDDLLKPGPWAVTSVPSNASGTITKAERVLLAQPDRRRLWVPFMRGDNSRYT